jgi:hypothetical protein
VAEERAAEPQPFTRGFHVRQEVAREVLAQLGVRLADREAPFPGHDGGVDHIHRLVRDPPQEAGEVGGREHARVRPRHLPLVPQADGAALAAGELLRQRPERAGQADERVEPPPHLLAEGGRVHGAPDGLPLERGQNLIGDVDGDGALRFRGGAAEVRRGDDPRVPQERMAGRRRLLREYVERRAGEAALLQGGEQRLLVDQAAARAVDEERAPFHRPELGAAQQGPGGRPEGDVERQHIRVPQHLRPGRQVDAEPVRPLLRDIGIARHDPHAEAERAPRHLGADLPQADDAQGLAGQLRADEPVAPPLAGAERSLGLGDVADERQQHGQRVLGGGRRAPLGRVQDEDPAPRRRVDVDVVDARPGPRDHAQPARLAQGRGGHPRPAPDDDRIGLGERGAQVVLRESVPQDDIPGGAQPCQALLGQPVGDENARPHHRITARHPASPRPVGRDPGDRFTRLRADPLPESAAAAGRDHPRAITKVEGVGRGGARPFRRRRRMAPAGGGVRAHAERHAGAGRLRTEGGRRPWLAPEPRRPHPT